jgi:hypothetical protein
VESIGAAIPAPDLWVVVATGIFALLVTTSALIKLSGRKRASLLWAGTALSTVIHESGHALTRVATGGRVKEFTITGAGTGSVLGEGFWLTNVISGAAGYAMPPLAGVGAAWLLSRGHAPAVLAITTVVMLLLLIISTDLTTITFILAVALLPAISLLFGTPALQNFVAYGETWLLLTNELGGLAHLVAIRKTTPEHNDADNLARRTLVPGSAWIIGWLTLMIWALWVGVPLMFASH